MARIPIEHITGLVLAGGEGRRMGGADKGLLAFEGEPLACRALHRLASQVGRCAISANRHLEDYSAFGVPVLTDTFPGHAGPLAGWLTGLEAIETPWLATVPCDVPHFPPDLVARLAEALEASSDLAMARTPGGPQPVFALLRRELAGPLRRALEQGQRSVQAWAGGQRLVVVDFADAAPFDNLNTPGALARARPDTIG